MVPYQVATSTFVNTHKDYFWLPNKIETAYSTDNWGISTSATTAAAYMKKATEYLDKTGKSRDGLPFMIHDFSMRGMFGREAAAMSGFGHLCSGSAGTDTIPAVLFAMEYYKADIKNELVGASVNATEHSVATTNIMYIEDCLARSGEYTGKSGKVYDSGVVAGYLQYVSSTEADPKLIAEYIFMRETLLEFNTGILSYVADSYDFWSVVEILLPALRTEIMARDGKFVIRPDSGDPVKILCGSQVKDYTGETKYNGDLLTLDDAKDWFLEELCEKVGEETPHGEYGDSEPQGLFKFEGKTYNLVGEIFWNRHDKQYYYMDETKISSCEEFTQSAETKGLIEALADNFGTTKTSKGFLELDSHIGAIYGDSITLERQDAIYSQLFAKGFCPEPVLGVGSYSYQYVTRDTHGSAVKATNVVKNGRDVEVCKEPKTDSSKKSARGLLKVYRDEDGVIKMKDQCTREEEQEGLLQVVFEDGVLFNETSLQEIRDRVTSTY